MHSFASDVVAPLAKVVAMFLNAGHARKRDRDADGQRSSKLQRVHAVSDVGAGSKRRLFERMSRHDIPSVHRSGDRIGVEPSFDVEYEYWQARKGKVLCLCVVAAGGRPLDDLGHLDSLEKVVAFQWWQAFELK